MAKVLSGKRLLIAKDNKTMFIIVAVTGVVLGACLVGVFRLSKVIGFNARVIGAKQETRKTLEENTKNVQTIKENLKTMSATSDETLKPLVVSGDLSLDEDVDTLYSDVLRVIADALPAYASLCDTNIKNTLRTSMSLKLLGPAVETLTVGDDSQSCLSGSATVISETDAPSGGENVYTVPFTFNISFSNPTEGSESEENLSAAGKIQQVMEKLELSIRTIHITNSQLTFSETGAEMRVSGVAYWTDVYALPADSTGLNTKTERMK